MIHAVKWFYESKSNDMVMHEQVIVLRLIKTLL